VKFQDERAVFTAVQRAVRTVLVTNAPVAKIENHKNNTPDSHPA